MTAARTAFGERGGDASLDGTARSAGVTNATLYRHFPTRDSLLEAAPGSSRGHRHEGTRAGRVHAAHGRLHRVAPRNDRTHRDLPWTQGVACNGLPR
ncbi:helix-turn-helix domain-containing protein [Amycolatopsis ultiminotia]|uniref:helix-turn-helix domain-containing protein n=1 Tax=Amycolatopsis ultiminotia TaxID=543629 RepID=UPI0031EF1BE7